MREMKDSGIEWIGAIPQDWKTDRLQWHLKEINVSNNPIQTKNILSLTIEAGVIPYAEKGNQGNKAKEDYSQYKIAFPDTLVINSMNVIIGAVGISQYFGCVSPVYYVFEPIEGTDLRYIYYLFTNTGFQKEMRKYAKGILEIRLRISSNDMLKRIVPSPPFKEQQRIADYLDKMCAEIDTVLEKTRASIEEYKKLKQAVITQAVTKGIRGDRPMKDSRIEWIGEIPESWEVSSVRYIGQLQNGISKGGEFFGKGFPFVSYGDVYKNYELPHSVSGLIDTTEDERATYSVEYGDIFFTRTSETIEEVGFSCVCKRSIPNATFAGFIIRLRPFCADEKILTDYAKYYFRGEHIRAYLVKEMNLVTRASLGQTLLKGMSVIVPPKSVQKEIAEYLDDKCADIDALVAKKQQYLTEIENYKKSLIYEYVTGKKEAHPL